MKSRYLLSLSITIIACLSAHSQSSERLSSAQARAAFQAEQTLIEQAREEASRGNSKLVEEMLLSQDGLSEQVAPTVLFARRAAEICAWLRNNNDYAGAMRVAERAVARLRSAREDNDADHAERLYWEAVLRAGFLDQKASALALLQEAERFAPDDERILETELELASALAEFGE